MFFLLCISFPIKYNTKEYIISENLEYNVRRSYENITEKTNVSNYDNITEKTNVSKYDNITEKKKYSENDDIPFDIIYYTVNKFFYYIGIDEHVLYDLFGGFSSRFYEFYDTACMYLNSYSKNNTDIGKNIKYEYILQYLINITNIEYNNNDTYSYENNNDTYSYKNNKDSYSYENNKDTYSYEKNTEKTNVSNYDNTTEKTNVSNYEKNTENNTDSENDNIGIIYNTVNNVFYDLGLDEFSLYDIFDGLSSRVYEFYDTAFKYLDNYYENNTDSKKKNKTAQDFKEYIIQYRFLYNKNDTYSYENTNDTYSYENTNDTYSYENTNDTYSYENTNEYYTHKYNVKNGIVTENCGIFVGYELYENLEFNLSDELLTKNAEQHCNTKDEYNCNMLLVKFISYEKVFESQYFSCIYHDNICVYERDCILRFSEV